MKNYYKLVRDRIPEIIESDGKSCICETLSDMEYLNLLDEKLNKELLEYQESKSLEELADLLEVVQAVVKARGCWMLFPKRRRQMNDWFPVEKLDNDTFAISEIISISDRYKSIWCKVVKCCLFRGVLIILYKGKG